MLLLLIFAVCVLPPLLMWGSSERARRLVIFGLVLDFAGGLLIALDGLPGAHDLFNKAPLMPWHSIDAALMKFAQATDSNTPALVHTDPGFDELIAALRRFNREIPVSVNDSWSLLADSTLTLYRVPVFSGNVTVNGVNHELEPVAGVVLGRRSGAPIVVGSEAAMRGMLDRYRLSWFVFRGMIPIVFGFGWQLLAMFTDRRSANVSPVRDERTSDGSVGSPPPVRKPAVVSDDAGLDDTSSGPG